MDNKEARTILESHLEPYGTTDGRTFVYKVGTYLGVDGLHKFEVYCYEKNTEPTDDDIEWWGVDVENRAVSMYTE